MNQILAIFTTRTSTMQYAKLLKGIRIPHRIISTPRAITKSCGISVTFSYSFLTKASLLINQYRIPNFKNFYLIKTDRSKTTYIPL